MKINSTYTFPARAEIVWDLLLDPQVLLQVIPGLESVDVKPTGEILATAMVGVGPVKGRFTGTLRLLDQQRPVHVRIVGEGKGGPGFMKGTCILDALEEGESTLVKYQAEVQIGGPLATVGQRLVDAATNSIMQQGFDRFNNVLTERRAAEAAARAAQDAAAQSAVREAVAAAQVFPLWLVVALGLALSAAVALVYFSKY
jgi:carbon monoxide dehydrogenase subunit G